MNNEHLYERVVEELRVPGPKEGLWAKAFAETNGQEAQAKALYLRYRVEQLAELERESARLDAENAEEHSRDAALAAEEKRKVAARVFADGSRIGGIVLAALADHAVRGDELRGNQFDGVAVGAEYGAARSEPCRVAHKFHVTLLLENLQQLDFK